MRGSTTMWLGAGIVSLFFLRNSYPIGTGRRVCACGRANEETGGAYFVLFWRQGKQPLLGFPENPIVMVWARARRPMDGVNGPHRQWHSVTCSNQVSRCSTCGTSLGIGVPQVMMV